MTGPRNRHSTMGWQAAFPMTNWTGLGSAEHQAALQAELYRQYRDPLYCFARRRGIAKEDAEDFTQAFLAEILMGREFLSRADRTRGRFRSLLVRAFQNHIHNSRRKRKVPTGTANDVSEYELAETVPHDPEAAFDYAWASNVLDAVLAELEAECGRDGLAAHWGIFQERVVQPLLGGGSALGLEEICRKYAIDTEVRASNMIVTVKRRFRRILERHLTGQDRSPEQVQEALRDFLEVFSRSGGA